MCVCVCVFSDLLCVCVTPRDFRGALETEPFHPSSMVSAQVRLALQAMRYYRLWIYASNLVLMAGVIIFASVAAALLSDPRRQLLPAAAVSPHQPSVVYAYAALFLQGAVLPVVGCIGALKLSEKLLNSYWILLLVLLAGDMIVGLVWVFRFQKLVAGLVPDLKNRLSLDYGHDPDFDAAWDLLQRSARCCGVESPADFNNSLWLANLADRPAWQPSGMSTNRVQLSSTPTHGQGGRSLRPSLIRDQRVSRLPLPDSCCKSASFTSEQLRKNGHFMSMASEVPPGRKDGQTSPTIERLQRTISRENDERTVTPTTTTTTTTIGSGR